MQSIGKDKRIAIFLSRIKALVAKGGGIERINLHLAEELLRQGYQVDLVLCRSDPQSLALVPPGIRVIVLPRASRRRAKWAAWQAGRGLRWQLLRPVLLALHPTTELRYLPGFINYVETHQPDAVISAFVQINLVALLAKRASRHRFKLLVEQQGPWSRMLGPEAAGSWRWRHLPPLLSRLYAEADAVVPVSAGIAEHLRQVAGLPDTLLRTIHNPVLDEQSQRRRAEPLTHPWFAPGEPPVILNVGRLDRQKDQATLLRAFARLRTKHMARLMILGEGDERVRLEALAQELGIAADVALPGFIANPMPYMRESTVFALSSLYEGLPTVLIEALYCGCPVVSTDCLSGPREILQDGRYGRLVPVGDDVALAEALTETITHPPDRQMLIQSVQGRGFTVAEAAERYLQVIELSA